MTTVFKNYFFTSVILATSLSASNAFAQNQRAGYDFARVISSQPIYETVEIDDGREVCHNEQVRVPQYSQSQYYERPRSESASVFGAILGGVIGNQFGRGRGRVAATVAGVALGSAIANDNDRQDRYRGRYASSRSVVSTERVCEYQPRVRTERQLTGYNVRYDYKGQVGETTTRNQPGSTIRVQIQVTAIDD